MITENPSRISGKWRKKKNNNKPKGHLLLNLMTTIGRCQIDDETKFPRRVVDVLSLEGALFSLIRPCQPFVEVKSAVENGRSQDQPPSHRFHKLQREMGQIQFRQI